MKNAKDAVMIILYCDDDPIRRERYVPFEVKEICEIYENRLKGTRFELSEKDVESTYNAQMDYTHVVRSTLNVLKKKGWRSVKVVINGNLQTWVGMRSRNVSQRCHKGIKIRRILVRSCGAVLL